MTAACHVCHAQESDDIELRPYGVNAQFICYDCMMSTPERQKEAEAQLGARLDAAAMDGDIVLIGGRRGPTTL